MRAFSGTNVSWVDDSGKQISGKRSSASQFGLDGSATKPSGSDMR
jgi:hypothetical protein